MAIDVKTPDSPGWWLARLYKKLDARRERVAKLYQRYEGNADLPETLNNAPEAAKAFFKACRTNYADTIVRSAKYKLEVTHVTITGRALPDGSDTAADSAAAALSASAAYQAWKDAGMPIVADDCHRNAAIAGDAYAFAQMNAPVEGSGDEPRPFATSEDARQAVTIHDPVDQSRIRAAGKFFRDTDEEMDYAYLIRPGVVYVARIKASGTGSASGKFSEDWDWDPERGGPTGMPLPAGFESTVPVVRYRNEEGVGDFEKHQEIFDRIDHLILQGMVIATLQAFKQRAIKADEDAMPEVDPETGERIDYDSMFTLSPDKLWQLPASAEMWESGAVDVTPISTLTRKDEERLSAVTFTPFSTFSLDGANQSANAADLIREGQVSKVGDKQKRFGPAHERLMAYLLRMANNDVEERQVRVRWAPAARYGLQERAAAGQLAKQTGMPFPAIMTEVWQFPPEVVDEMESARQQELADALAMGADPADASA